MREQSVNTLLHIRVCKNKAAFAGLLREQKLVNQRIEHGGLNFRVRRERFTFRERRAVAQNFVLVVAQRDRFAVHQRGSWQAGRGGCWGGRVRNRDKRGFRQPGGWGRFDGSVRPAGSQRETQQNQAH